jgi:hypothetical protein
MVRAGGPVPKFPDSMASQSPQAFPGPRLGGENRRLVIDAHLT